MPLSKVRVKEPQAVERAHTSLRFGLSSFFSPPASGHPTQSSLTKRLMTKNSPPHLQLSQLDPSAPQGRENYSYAATELSISSQSWAPGCHSGPGIAIIIGSGVGRGPCSPVKCAVETGSARLTSEGISSRLPGSLLGCVGTGYLSVHSRDSPKSPTVPLGVWEAKW